MSLDLLPWSRHRFDPAAYVTCDRFRNGALVLEDTPDLWHSFWAQRLQYHGEGRWSLTDHGREFLADMDRALHRARRCSSCGGVYHPATGHAFTLDTQICGPCARHFLQWVKAHTQRRWGGVRFYDYATPRRTL